MEATVRRIPTHTSVVDGKEFAIGSKPALCFRGETYALGIINDDESIRQIVLTLVDHDKAPLLMQGPEEYPVKKFISHMERIMQEKPISDEALHLMEDWPNNPTDFGDKRLKKDEDDASPAVERKPRIPKPQNCIPAIAGEHKTTPQKVRKFLRSKGLSAPYADEKKIQKLMKDYK